ncbi:MAG: putative membrane protein [Oleispira sp.]|jgi:putative membrane protein
MKLVKNFLILLMVSVVFIYGILFALYNEQNIGLDFLFLDTLSVPLSLWSGSLVVLGIVMGLLVASISKMLQGIENKRLKKELKQMKAKLEKLNH